MKSTWAAHGSKWIFVVADASSASAADAYINEYGVTFGWRTNDADNTQGSYSIAYSSIYGGYPWTGVIRASDMQLVYDESDTSYLDIATIAAELDPG